MARKFTRSRGRDSSRRQSAWLSIPPAVNTLAAASTAVVTASLNAAALAMRPFTVVRTHISWLLKSDQQAASEQYAAAVGFAVVSDQASAVGVTAVPTPVTDLGSDLWFLHASVVGFFALGTAVGFIEQGVFKDIDSKAMRRVNDDQDMVLVEETYSTSAGAITHNMGRFFIKLH